MRKRLHLIAISCLGSVTSVAFPYGTGVSQSTYSGLYDSSGNSVYTTTSVTQAKFDLQYTGTFTTVGNIVTDHYDPVSGVMKTTVQIIYNNNKWSSAPDSAVVGVQGINYWHYLHNGNTNCTLTIADDFEVPTTSIFTMTTTSRTYDTTYSDVNPRLFQVNLGTTDTTDPTGDTAKYVYNCTSTSYNPPWQSFPQYSNSYDGSNSQAGLVPAIWLFAKPTASGAAYSAITDYPVSGG